MNIFLDFVDFPSQTATTVVVYGDIYQRNPDSTLDTCIKLQLSNVPNSINELILAHLIPNIYLDVILSNSIYKDNIKRLTFYSYKTTPEGHFLHPCDFFVNLEELTFELTDLKDFNLKKCGPILKKLHILNANYFKNYDVSTNLSVEIVELRMFGNKNVIFLMAMCLCFTA